MTTKIIPPAFITQSEEAYDKGYDPKVARGLMRFAKPYTGQMLFALLLMIIVTVAAVSGPYFVKLAIDEGIGKKDIPALRTIVLAYLTVACIQLVLTSSVCALCRGWDSTFCTMCVWRCSIICKNFR